MTHATTTYSQESPVNILAFGPSIAELQLNPVPEDLFLLNQSLPYRMVNDTEFYATYHLANDISHKIFSDKFRLSVLQLNQLEHATEDDIACRRVLWAKFFKATTWEEVFTLANQDPIFAEAAKTIYRVTEDERVRYHCDAIERGERTHRTLVNQLNEQEQQLAEKDAEIERLLAENAALKKDMK